MCQPGFEPRPAVCETAMLTITPFCSGQKEIYSVTTNANAPPYHWTHFLSSGQNDGINMVSMLGNNCCHSMYSVAAIPSLHDTSQLLRLTHV